MSENRKTKDTGHQGDPNDTSNAPIKSHEETAEREDGASRNVTPQALRALAEAEERRRRQTHNDTTQAKEIGGRDGPDPIRFGDWEKGGIASDF